jgi:hypothetical protein
MFSSLNVGRPRKDILMRVNARKATVAVLFLVVCWMPSVYGQTSTSGGITGVVTDQTGAVVPSVVVQVEDRDKGDTQESVTNGDGLYLFSFLPPGLYTVTFVHADLATATRNLEVPLGPPVTLNVRLRVAAQRAAVRVTEDAPLIRAENGDVAATIGVKQIAQVPNPGNDLTYLVQTAPGMIMNTDGGAGNFSNLGMPGTSNQFTVNGMLQNDFGANVNVAGALGLFLGSNQVEEVAVVSNGYSQFGSAAGANVNYITKSGGNSIHGNAVYYWNGTVLNANNWFNNAFGISRPPDHAHQWAGSLGGPVRKDKLFFFVNTEGARLLLPTTEQVQLPSPQFEAATIDNIDARFGPVSASDAFYKKIFALYNAAPGAAGTLPGDFAGSLGCGGFVGPAGLGTAQPCAEHYVAKLAAPDNQWLLSGRLDWNVSNSDRVFLLIQSDHGSQRDYSDPISPIFNLNANVPSWQGQLVETRAFGPSAANQFLVSGWWQGFVTRSSNLPQSLSAFPTVLNWNAAGGLFANLGGINNFFPEGRNATHFQISDDFTKSLGHHNLAFGVDDLQAYVTVFGYSANTIGTLKPFSLDAFYQGGADPVTPTADFTTLNQVFSSQASERFRFSRLGAYASDEWHLRPNLKVVPTLRVEHQSNPVCQRHCIDRLTGPFESVSHDPSQPYNQVLSTGLSHVFQDLNNLLWSPRLSFAWQPLGVSRNTVLRSGFGIFFDPLPAFLISPARFSGNPPLLNSYVISGDNLTPGEGTSLFKDASASNTAFLNGLAAGLTLAQIRAKVAGFSPPGLSLPEAKTFSPQYQKWSLELQQGIGADSKFSLGYYGNHGIHELLENPSANAFGFGPLPGSYCGTPVVAPCADPRFSQVIVDTNGGISNYNGMVASFEHRFTQHSQGLFRASYTYGHAFDETSNGGIFSFTSGSSSTPQDPFHIRGAYGPAEYDVRHSLTSSYVWQIPLRAAFRGHGPAAVLNGWQVSGTVFARTGFPYTVFDGGESFFLLVNNNYGSEIYGVLASRLGPQGSCGKGAAQPASPNPCLPPQILPSGAPNPNSAFVQSGCETGFNVGYAGAVPPNCSSGNLVHLAQGRNQFRGPAYVNTDFSILKNTKLPGWEGGELSIGAQFFNFFNHPNFGFPVHDITSPQFGQIFGLERPPSSLLGSGLGGNASARLIQLTLRLQF